MPSSSTCILLRGGFKVPIVSEEWAFKDTKRPKIMKVIRKKHKAPAFFLKVQKSKIYLFICLANFILNRPKDAKKFESSSLTGKKAKVLREKGLYYVSRIGLIERRFH